MTLTFRRLLALAFLLPILAASPARAQLYNAGDPCPEPTPGRIFTQEGAAGPSLVCNGTTLEVDESVTTGPYARGVGTATPQATLDVNGGVRIGADTTCAAAKEGTIRYVAASDVYEFCNGASWISLTASVGGATGQSMVAGWPDAIVCNVTNPNLGLYVFIANAMPWISNGKYYYRNPYSVTDYDIVFNADGTFNSYGNMTTTNCNVSIATLISGGKAFNLANGAVGTAAQMSDGTAGAPGLYFLSDTNTGLYRPGNDILAVATAGVEALRVTATGSMGIGTITPKAPLHVAGEAIIGPTTGLACNANLTGGLRWNTGSGCMEICNGTAWACPVMTAACDGTPASFDFTDQNGLSTSTLTESNILPITGTDSSCSVIVSVSGTGSPEYRICADSICSSVTQTWTASNMGFDMNGKYIQIRATTDSTSATTRTITANVGSGSTSWDITTVSSGPCGDVGPADIGTTCSDGSVYAGISPDGNRNMYVARCDIGMSWNGSDCVGARSLLPWNNGNNLGYVNTTFTSLTTGRYNTQEIILLDSDSGTAGIQPHQATQSCADLADHGQTDWYLPSRNELAVIYENLMDGIPDDNLPDPLITGFYNNDYWSSSENSINHVTAWKQRFSDGTQHNGTAKHPGYAIRCARRD